MEIHFEIENRCLLKCRHCSSYANNDGLPMEYSIEDMMRFLSKVEEEKTILLTGGEPLLYPKLDDLLDTLNTRLTSVKVGLFTTGIMENGKKLDSISETYAKQMASKGLKMCYLSVYSTQEEIHDWMTNRTGSFEMLKRSVFHLKDAGIEVNFNSVVSKKNKKSLGEIIDMAADWKINEVRFLKLIKHGRANACWEEIVISEEEYRDCVRNIVCRKNSVYVSASGVVDLIPCRWPCEREVCPAGRNLLYITYHGDVYPCASVKNDPAYRIGNIKNVDLWEKYRLFCEKRKEDILCWISR